MTSVIDQFVEMRAKYEHGQVRCYGNSKRSSDVLVARGVFYLDVQDTVGQFAMKLLERHPLGALTFDTGRSLW